MAENSKPQFWHRRATQLAGGVALFVIVFSLIGQFAGESIGLGVNLRIGILPTVLAGLTLLAAGLTFLPNIPTDGQKTLPIIVQGLSIATIAILIHVTGGFYSSFLALWAPAVILIAVFGTPALLAAALLPVLYSGWLALSDIFTLSMGITAVFAGGIPIILSYILFSQINKNNDDSTYNQLASQFSQVSDKSEVVITAITDGVVATDKQGVIELINPAAQRLIGWESRDALKLDYKSVLKLVDAQSNELTPASDPVRKALSTNEEVRTDELTLITNSGKKLLISLVASPVGQPGSGIIVVFRDITKEKAEEREQAEFISTASHEMRTPVASIEGYLGLALNPATAQIDDKARTYIMKAHEVAQHLGRLFQDLLDITKAEDGRLSNNPRAVEVVNFVQDVVEGLRPQAEAKGLVLLYKPVPDEDTDEKSSRRLNPVYYANVDNDHLREVVANLVENAIKYTPQGTISVDVTGDDKQVQISVQDTGIGIPAEDLSHLFQKFYRVDNSDTREIGGTGLGLYLSRRLAEAMEGRIWAESQHGQGSTFFISIPRISHEEAMQLIETLDGDAPSTSIGPAVSNQPITPEEAAATFTPAPTPQPVSATPSTPTAPALPNEGVFVNPPADTIAAQLTAAPTSPAQQPAAPTGPTLASIEQNPGQYLTQAGTTTPTQVSSTEAPIQSQPHPPTPQPANPSAQLPQNPWAQQQGNQKQP